MAQPIVFSGSPLDRAGNRRRDETWIAQQLEREESRFLPLWRLSVLVKNATPRALGWARNELREHVSKTGEIVLLGLKGDVAHFAVDVSGLEKPEAELGVVGVAKFEDVRAVAPQLPLEEAAITAQARACIDWHARHRFCSVCGHATTSGQGGLVRECDECNAEHFPRTDPVVIMLVVDGDRCLLGRQAAWPGSMYSALAGFVDQGETIEEAVRREVEEEAGLSVGGVRYLSSQPWPFPSSLMIGCLARAESVDVKVDPGELAEARWFEREEIRKVLAEPDASHDFGIPPPMAIAHHLIRGWADGESV